MISMKTFGVFAVCVVGCGSPKATTATGTPTTTTTGTGGTMPCGNSAERCCTTGELCAAGLTCSDEFCLACGPAPVSTPECVNVAPDGTASAAISVGDTFVESRFGNDNDICTPWNYNNFGNADSYWQVDLGAEVVLDRMTVWPKMTPSDGQVSLLIQYKVNDADAFIDYPTAGGITLTMYDYQPWQTVFAPALTARFFRITITASPSYAALREVGLYTNCP